LCLEANIATTMQHMMT